MNDNLPETILIGTRNKAKIEMILKTFLNENI